MQVPTIKVYDKKSGEEMVINESDLNTDIHASKPIKKTKKSKK